MIELKQMSYGEKYAKVLEQMAVNERFLPAFVRQWLGGGAEAEVRRRWEEGMQPIPEDASEEEKYETAYANWLWQGKVMFAFVRERMGVEGVERLKGAMVAALKEKYASPALWFLKLLRAIAPGYAFKMTAQQSSYQLQWLTPYTVEELTDQRAVVDIPKCKALEVGDTDDMCQIACQQVYPRWLQEQFGVDMRARVEGLHCTLILSPIG